MKRMLSKVAVLVLAASAAGAVYVYRDAYLQYWPWGAAEALDAGPDTPVAAVGTGTREDPYVGRGVIRQLQPNERQLVLEHGDIPGFMGAMTMGYPVSDEIALDALTVGEEVEVRFENLDRAGAGGPPYQIFELSPVAAAEPSVDTSAAMFRVDTGRQQLIGVRTAAVTEQSVQHTLRTVGTVVVDETRANEVHSKVSGWIEETFVDYQYQHVREGDPLLTLYSPELVATQEEYLLALRGLDTLGESAFPTAAFGAEDLVRAARRRLELWDVSADQIERLEETREPLRAIVIHSPVTGHVMIRNAFPSQRITPEMLLYGIVDHSVVWVEAALYENDLAWVAIGQPARLHVQGLPDEQFQGRVTFVNPHLNEETRTLGVRLEFENPDLTLKPGMYADVELERSLGRRLVVPESAVLPTGLRSVVFVDHGDGQMEIREVRLGRRMDDYYEVLAGLTAGERIVISGNFLIDAESKLQAAEPVWQGEPQP